MKLKLKRLEFLNFKGGKQEIDFSERTDIFADNAVGKTRTFDALLWLLFGKDSEGKSDFEIKPLLSNNQVKHKVDVEVTGLFDYNGKIIELMKVYKEKWTKKRGEAESNLTGHTTDFYIDKMNVNKKEYETYIFSIIETEKFKMLTNPTYFETLRWQQKRAILFNLVDSVSDNDIAKTDERFVKLLQEIGSVDMAVYKKGLVSKRRALNEDLRDIPARIDEVERSKPEPVDFMELKKQRKEHLDELVKIDEIEKNKESAVNDVLEKRKQIYEEIQKLENRKIDIKSKIEIDYNSKYRQTKSLLENLNIEFKNNGNSIIEKEDLIAELEKSIKDRELQIAELRDDWFAEDKKIFNPTGLVDTCPVCKQHLPEENITRQKQELLINFNRQKERILNEINRKGQNYKKVIENNVLEIKLHEDSIKTLKKTKSELSQKIEDLEKKSSAPTQSIEDVINQNDEYKSLISKIEEITKTLPESPNTESEFQAKKNELSSKIDIIEIELRKEQEIEKANKRIKELEEKTKVLSQQIADLEQKEYLIEQFTKKKIELIEMSINDKFKYVKFKLYQQQINEGEKETCITLINGVPFSSANYAARINAGLDIINVLSEHYDIFVPVVIDNRESISEILSMQTQVINLIKEKGQKTLRIENN